MNFKEIKSKIKSFVEDELFPLEPWILNSEWDEKLPKLNELRDKVKSIGLWLPQIPKNAGTTIINSLELYTRFCPYNEYFDWLQSENGDFVHITNKKTLN